MYIQNNNNNTNTNNKENKKIIVMFEDNMSIQISIGFILLLINLLVIQGVTLSNSVHIEYKTTYACDGNVLGLSCRPDESMHLVRANYGRFSLSICNDGGKLDLKVNCRSFRSYLILQDRCSGKSKCNVTVSSDLFGNPCPGTSKYLEVQYHCVPSDLHPHHHRYHFYTAKNRPYHNSEDTQVAYLPILSISIVISLFLIVNCYKNESSPHIPDLSETATTV